VGPAALEILNIRDELVRPVRSALTANLQC
jgi:hypothetical protein